MGTILYEGEYILVSHKIVNNSRYMGYSILSHIGINTSKVNYIGSTRHFCTYAVIKDLELPFDTSEWQDFEVNSVRCHAYTRNFKNLILMEHDECPLFDYFDDMEDFFINKEKEKWEKKENKKMTIEANNYIYIASNTAGLRDSILIKALFGYAPTCTEYELIHGCALLWSRTKLLHEISFDVTDALSRLHNLNTELDFLRTTKGDVIIYKDVNDKFPKILKAYHEYRDNNDTEKEKETMLNNKFIVNEDYFMTGVSPLTNNPYFDITHSVPDKLPEITLEDLRIESSVTTEPMIRGTFRVSPGIVREERRFQFTQYAGYKQLFEGGPINNPRHLLNSFYGLNGGLNYKRRPLKFKLIFGQEHATGREKTICLWEDGEKTIIHGDNKVAKLPVAQAFAWCYVKRTFGTVSHFKKHVDKRTTKMDGVWYFEGDCIMDDYAQGSVPGTSKKRDIYDAAALAIVTKRYGGLRRLVDEYIHKEDENGTR